MTHQNCESPAGDKPAEVSEQNRLQRVNGASLDAADMALEALIKQLDDAMQAAVKARDMVEARRLMDLMYAGIGRRSPQFIKHRCAEINKAISGTAATGRHFDERRSPIGGAKQ